MLTDDNCDKLVAQVMDKLAAKHSDQYGAMHALDLNPSITEHHSLRRSVVRAAYELGEMNAAEAPLLERIAELERALRWESDLCQQALESRSELERQLAQPVGEPVAQRVPDEWHSLVEGERDQIVADICNMGVDFVTPLYAIVEGIERKLMERNAATPPQQSEQVRKPLTTKQINDLSVWPRMKLEEVVRVIEAAHGIAAPQPKD